MSFIPFDRYSRQINYSRYNIGGAIHDQNHDDGLSGYLFTDRGIYRPGEKANIGLIVKKHNFVNVSGIPLELVIRGPRGNTLRVEKFLLPEKGLTDFNFITDATTDTGLYKVDLYLIRDNRRRGRIVGTGRFRVEEFKPDTLKIESRLLGQPNKGWFTPKSVKARVSLKNLFGKPAQQRKVSGKITIQPTNFSFPDYKNYTFLDPFKQIKEKPLSLKQELESNVTDQKGLTEFDISLDRFSSGSYILDLNIEAFDQGGGRSVKAFNRIMIAPHPYLIGYKSGGKLDYIHKAEQRTIEFIAINSRLEPEKKNDLVARLLEVKHLSTLVRQKNGTYQYQTLDREKELSANPLSINIAGTHYTLPTAVPGDYVLEIVDQQHTKLIRVPFSVVGHTNLVGNLEREVELQLKLNKEEYQAGEIIELNIKGPYLGSGLISIESDKVHNYKWFKADTQSTMQMIKIPDSLQGNAYVNVSLLRDINSKQVFSSPLSYAVAPFKVDHRQHELDVGLTVEKLVRPGKDMEITFRTARFAKVIVFAVDEGILQVANYATPNPLAHFLRKRSLGVTTLQILDLILPEFDFAKHASASGGGSARMRALAKNLNPFSRKTDKAAIYWSGVVQSSGSDQSLYFKVPDNFSGALRVMAVAVNDTAVGVAESQTLVRGPFVISPNLLTHAAPDDEFIVSVGIANLVKKSGKNARITVGAEVSNQLKVIEGNGQELIIAEDSEAKVDFKIKVGKSLGAAQIKFVASLNRDGQLIEQGVRSAGLSIRPPIPYSTTFDSGYSSDDSKQLPISRQLLPDLAEQRVSASASPLVLVEGLSNYLQHFPHGCTEQIVSQVFPLVGLVTHSGMRPNTASTRVKFKKLVDKLRERQLGNGGFSFWAGERTSASYPSIYVMHFLIETRELGYPIPERMMTRGRDFLRYFVRQSVTTLGEARIRANAIYLLTRLGDVTTNYLYDLQRYLEDSIKDRWKSDLTGAYIAATYQLLKKNSEAEELIGHYKLGSRSKGVYDDFHSPLTQDGQYIYLLSKHFEAQLRSMDASGLLNLIEPIFKGEYNTISAAYATLALGAYSSKKLNGEFDKSIRFFKTDHKKIRTLLATKKSPFPTAVYENIASQIEIASSQAFYYLNTQAGFDQLLPEKEIKQGLEIYREFVDENGEPTSKYVVGRELTVKLRIRATERPLYNIAIVDLFPGGFEVIRNTVPRSMINRTVDYVDVREDRVVIYGNFNNTLTELSYKVRITAGGKFIVPPAFAESMYDRSVKAQGKAGVFEVTVPN
ncbi:alpha-2-macroglobulin [Pseudomonadota bacterium]